MRAVSVQRILVALTVAMPLAVAAPHGAGAVGGFGDVPESSFYTEAVVWLASQHLTNGTSPGCYSPGQALTRGQYATFTWRQAGSPLSSAGSATFSDVPAGRFDDVAVGWMAAGGLTTGTAPGKFSPDQALTRGQYATFTWRQAGSPLSSAGSVTFSDVPAGRFDDVAVGWMAAGGLTTGTAPGKFSPDQALTRGQYATFTWRQAGSPSVTFTPGGWCRSFAGFPSAGTTVTASVSDLLGVLPVRAENRAGYSRSLFRLWSDLNHNGCDTRQEVLAAESVVAVSRPDGCRVTAGSWLSSYDLVIVNAPSSLDIDHMVPLAEVWDSGGSAWDSSTRERYANDQDDPRTLRAVTAHSNRSKSDQDPATWLPVAADRCEYETEWVVVKFRWQLSVDQAELDALRSMCPAGEASTVVTVTVAAVTASSATPTTPTTTPTTTAPGTPPNPGDAVNCSSFTTHAAAQTWFDTYFPYYGDVARLDSNHDGIACVSLP